MIKEDFWKYWKIETDRGRAVWRFTATSEVVSNSQKYFYEQLANAFTFDKASNPNSADRVYRANYEREIPHCVSREVADVAQKGIAYYEQLQTQDGNWIGDYAGPMFLLPGLIIASYVCESPFPIAHQTLMSRYMLNHQNKDGGWGLHLEGTSTMFGTVLQYVSLRILGLAADDDAMTKSRTWILDNGGATGIPSWGKFYLSVLGLYDWVGCNSLMPEIWLLPKWLPFHPSRYWCHSRMVYLPMSYCYGHRVVMEETPLIRLLRSELYEQPYTSINWKNARDKCCEKDIYCPQLPVLRVLHKILNVIERVHSKIIRRKALDFTLAYIHAEDTQTDYIDIGPVNQVINSIAIYHACGKDSEAFKKHCERWYDYLWLAEDGMKMQGYNGSQLWDTAFAVQAVVEGGFGLKYPTMVAKAQEYIAQSQILTDVKDREKFFRHIQVGGFPFSTLAHGWPITDCTAEGLKVILEMYKANPNAMPVSRLYDAVNVILSYQNKNGGWATYENTRAPKWTEWLNPSEIFGDIMLDHSYTECSSASVQALLKFHQQFPTHRVAEIKRAIQKGIEYILIQQRVDGAWYGSWAVCFTYGTWFGIEALSQFIKANLGYDELTTRCRIAIVKACTFLVSKQNEDGGWGESFESCVKKEYIPSPTSQVVNTSWAAMSLMAADYTDKVIIELGINLICQRQLSNGDWAQENISGVFNHNCMITYTAYRNVFPIWALGRYKNTVSTL